MLRKFLPILLAAFGLAIGSATGFVLRAPVEDSHAVSADQHSGSTVDLKEPVADIPKDYVRLNNQFIVPLVDAGRVSALVILSISIEVEPGMSESVFEREPKLRDVFLQVMFDHANSGGFRGTFTDGASMLTLRRALREAAQRVLGPIATDVLIMDILRQDS